MAGKERKLKNGEVVGVPGPDGLNQVGEIFEIPGRVRLVEMGDGVLVSVRNVNLPLPGMEELLRHRDNN